MWTKREEPVVAAHNWPRGGFFALSSVFSSSLLQADVMFA